MRDLLPLLSYWGYAAAAFAYAAIAIWLFHKYRFRNRQQAVLTTALAITSLWAFFAVVEGPASNLALVGETLRNLGWLSFMFVLLKSGSAEKQPRVLTVIYAILLIVLLCQPVIDTASFAFVDGSRAENVTLQAALTTRMIFAAGALVLVHNLYTVSAPETRWGISLPMAALAAMWMFDLNFYTISYLTGTISAELLSTRGFANALLAPIFVMASQRNSDWGIRLSRSVAFRSASLLVIGGYLALMLIVVAVIDMIGGDYTRLAQVTLIFGMTLAALLIIPSGKFRAWLNVTIAKNFFQHRYDYRGEWMRFADTIGFPSATAAPLNERAIKSLADIFHSPAGLLFVRNAQDSLVLEARWNWPTSNVPEHPMPSQTLPFFEATGHIVSMDHVRTGKDNKCDPRAVPQWLFDEKEAWAVIPLVHFGKLAGIAVLARPLLPRSLDWEDLDMLRVVGRQLASYLAEASSQQALAETQQFDQFNRRFAFVAHDIKNLVSQLSILARNAERHADKPAFRADMVDTLQSSVGKMNDLLARLSQHNRARHNAPVAVDISEVVMKSAHAKRLIYPIDAELQPGLMAMADPARVETIINHLVQNGIEATSDGAPIRIHARRTDGGVAISVTDRGSGMSEAFIANQLFKPFDSTKDGGFGIGAYEARTLAQSMGGQLRVESRIGKGTTFTLWLPMAGAQVDDNNPIGEAA